MRKSFDTLAAIVTHTLGKDPLNGEVFVFCNRRHDRIKILLWDRNGYWLAAKRLEKGTFAWPTMSECSREMTPEELTLLLGGIDLTSTRRRRWYRHA